nr:MAG TPA: hypothetical protein [Caudoviricetes sp.]
MYNSNLYLCKTYGKSLSILFKFLVLNGTLYAFRFFIPYS